MRMFFAALAILAAALIFFLGAPRIFAAQRIPFAQGFYINLAGGSADLSGNIDFYNDEADCRTGMGMCIAQSRLGQDYPNGNVQRYICRGEVLNCDNTHASGAIISGPTFAKSAGILDTPISCNQTVQLDVFDRPRGNLKGFMTWFSGTCTSPMPTLTPVPTSQARVALVPQVIPQPTETPMVQTPVPTFAPAITPLPTVVPTPRRVVELPRTGVSAGLPIISGGLILLGAAFLKMVRRI